MRYLAFAILCYAAGMAAIAAAFWMLAFQLDSAETPFRADLAIRNALAFLIFPLQHSLLARSAWKRWIVMHIHPLMERPLYVGTSGLALGAALLLWKPFGPVLFQTSVRFPFHLLFFTSLILIVWTTKIMDHTALFGLKQGRAAGRGESFPDPPLNRSGLFRHIRHPLTTLLIIAIWSHPTLTASRLLLNVLITAYSLLGVVFEERDLVKKYGREYEDYRRETPAFIPSPRTFFGTAGR